MKIKRFTRDNYEKEFALSRLEEVECQAYDGIIVNPAIEVSILDEENIAFNLPNHQRGIISLARANDPEIQFQ